MKTALFVLALVFSINTNAQELSPQSLFNRCYIQLTGSPVPLGHSLMEQVKSGKITALAACSQILNKAALATSGALVSKDAEAKAVLNNFYTFHRTWFPTNNFDSISGYSTSEFNGTVDLYDSTEPALAITYSVFGPKAKYSDVLTRATGVTALREEDATVKTRMKWTGTHAGRFLSNTAAMDASPFTFRMTGAANTVTNRNINKHVSFKANPPTIQVGDLVGIRPTTQTFTVPNVSLAPLGTKPTDKGDQTPDLNFSYDLFKTYGGGVMGTPVYLMQYYGHGLNMKFNGGQKVARRWSQQNMESFLCASLPALRESDITQWVDAKSSLAFRNSGSCVMCHATLDPMAYTARNITMGATDYLRPTKDGDDVRSADGTVITAPAGYARNALALVSYKAAKNSVGGWPAENVADFHTQQPTGRLYFRSFQGTLVDKPVTNIATLGQAMSETDDYYICAAKRYFEFMTGIVVPLYDRTDPKNADLNKSLTPEAAADRAYVEDLAKTLRSTGSVVNVLEDIMASPYFRKENYR